MVCPGTSLEKEPPRVCPLERDDSSLNQGFALLDECDHIVSGLMDHSVIAAFHLRHRSCSDKSSELCLEAEVLNPTIGTFFTMDAIHSKVGLPNFVLSQPGHVRQHPDTIDRFAEKPCGGYLWTSRTLFTLLFTREEK